MAGESEANRRYVAFAVRAEVEKVQSRLYHVMLDNLDSSKESYPYYVCPVCGLTAKKEPPGVCTVCGTRGDLFKKIE